METPDRLSDFNHPNITSLATRLTADKESPLEIIESMFLFVRDEIKFGFTPVWDTVKASEVLNYGLGYCNTKATLFVALCRAAGFEARVHFGLIDIRIMRGIMPGFVFPFMPKLGGHSWSEVLLDQQWKPIDSYINDKPFYERASKRLKKSGHPIGFSVSYKDGKSSCEFNFGDQGFVHMGAVREDHGAWEDPADYFATDKYVRFNKIQAMSYPLLAVMSNRNVARIRQSDL
jgi:hypothetical protein